MAFITRIYLYFTAIIISSIIVFIVVSASSQGATSFKCIPRCDPTAPPICNGNWVQTCRDCNGDQKYEWCNDIDCSISGQVCDGGICQADYADSCADNDGDGYGNPGNPSCTGGPETDCDDNNRLINPNAVQVCGSGVDYDCDGNLDCPFTATMLLPASNGLSYDIGDSLSIRVQIAGGVVIDGIYAMIFHPADITGWVREEWVYLYDDGAHNDGRANDGIWGDTWIVVADPGQYSIGLFLEKNYRYDAFPWYELKKYIIKNIRQFEIIRTAECKTLVNNGPSADKLDIVFIGDDYSQSNLATFAQNVNTSKDYLLTIPPFNTHSSKMNFHRIDNTIDLKCAYNCYGIQRLLCCDSPTVRAVASACLYDQIVVLVNNSEYGGSAVPRGQIAISSTGYRMKGIVVHEFGHSFAGLYDEYVYDEYVSDEMLDSSADSPNCDDRNTCPRWAGTPGTVCIKGCTYNNWYRSINNGIMRDSSSTDFGVVNINHINTLFNYYR